MTKVKRKQNTFFKVIRYPGVENKRFLALLYSITLVCRLVKTIIPVNNQVNISKEMKVSYSFPEHKHKNMSPLTNTITILLSTIKP